MATNDRITRKQMTEAMAQLDDWYATGKAQAPTDFDLVDSDSGCTCGERRVDALVWLTDDSFECQSCGEITNVWDTTDHVRRYGCASL